MEKRTFTQFILSGWSKFVPIIVITLAMIASYVLIGITEGLVYGLAYGTFFLLIDILIIFKTHQHWKKVNK